LKILEAVNIRKSYRVGFLKHREILKGVDFSVEQGEFACLMGRSGGGKTTFLKILAGILPPSKGKLYFHEKKVGFFKSFYTKKIAFIFQDYKLIPHLNVFENVSLPLRIRNIPDWKEKVNRYLDFTGIRHLSKQYPYQLSGGEAQRTSIARALSVEPEIIFADEPTGNLDQKTEKEILEVFEKIHKDLKKTFILVTHEPDLIRLSDSSYELREGKLFEIK
jgi:ABC-type lipoprotein export system ATPase subunit